MAADGANNPDNVEEAFVYTGGDMIVPRDVVRCRVHPSVTIIPFNSFHYSLKLEEVEFCEGLLEIGPYAFQRCTSLKQITIPSTVAVIRDMAFEKCCQLEKVELCEGLQGIESYAFYKCMSLKRMAIPSTVAVINDYAFAYCEAMEEVELHEGLLEIGEYAFHDCISLKQIKIPSTVKVIGDMAFSDTSLLTINLPDGIESIGEDAFSQGRFPNARIPPLITTIPRGMFSWCTRVFSVELPESISSVEMHSLVACDSLRNIAFPPSAQITLAFEDEDGDASPANLVQFFDSPEQIINALKHRFDNLPIHKMIYYQSYNPVTINQLNDATIMKSDQQRPNKLDPTGKQWDCFGMTPLHILTCSTVQNLELYQVMVEKYPENLITKDGWGALPLLYVVWGNAPSEIVQYLVESYQSIYPDYKFNWTEMVQTLAEAKVPNELIQNLLNIQQESFPEQCNWNEVLNNLVEPESQYCQEAYGKVFRFIVHCGLAKRIKELGLKEWRKIITNGIESIPDYDDSNKRKASLDAIRSKLAMFETEYQNLKESTTIVELAFWKKRMNDVSNEKKEGCNVNKKMKIEAVDAREQCRISCGADIVIEHMLPYLLPATDEIQHQPADSDDESSNSDSSLFR